MRNQRPSKRQWRQAWRSWPDGFMLLGLTDDGSVGNVDFRILIANRAACRLLGSRRFALRGVLLGRALPSWRTQGVIDRLANELSVGTGGTCDVATGDAPDVRLAIACVGAGRLGLMISPIEGPGDVTTSALPPSRPSSSEMIASLSHELRNPLAGLTHALSILTAEDGQGGRPVSARSTALLELARLTKRVEEILDSDPAPESEGRGRHET